MDLAAARTPRKRTGHTCDPIGEKEVAEMLGVKITTVYQWRHRKVSPEPDFIVNGLPAWDRATIEEWARETGRLTSLAG
jgi:predicted DNA-binding transcriptional regulator AlpA